MIVIERISARQSIECSGEQSNRFSDCQDRRQVGCWVSIVELPNDITRKTQACVLNRPSTMWYEDPSFAFEKFPRSGSDTHHANEERW